MSILYIIIHCIIHVLAAAAAVSLSIVCMYNIMIMLLLIFHSISYLKFICQSCSMWHGRGQVGPPGDLGREIHLYSYLLNMYRYAMY